MVGMLAGKMERQRESIPRAYRRIPASLLAIYLLAVLMLGLTVSPDDPLLTLPTPKTSALNLLSGASGAAPRNYPGAFIVMAERAGIRGLPTFINVVMIVAIISAATADVYFAVLFL